MKNCIKRGDLNWAVKFNEFEKISFVGIGGEYADKQGVKKRREVTMHREHKLFGEVFNTGKALVFDFYNEVKITLPYADCTPDRIRRVIRSNINLTGTAADRIAALAA